MGIFGSNRDDDDDRRREEAERPIQPQEMEQRPPEEERTSEQPTRAAVTEERPPRRDGDEDDEYQWHTGRQRPHGQQDAVEFVEVHKAFGRNKILRGLNMGIPENKISMILGPSGTGKSVCI